jgi:hypothetical protein
MTLQYTVSSLDELAEMFEQRAKAAREAAIYPKNTLRAASVLSREAYTWLHAADIVRATTMESPSEIHSREGKPKHHSGASDKVQGPDDRAPD